MNVTDYVQNRQGLAACLLPASVAVIHSNDIMPTNNNGSMHFRQNNDLYWLTGILQEETTLVLFPGHPDSRFREMLFLKKVDEHFVKWNGRRLTMEQAAEISGIGQVYWQEEFEQVFYAAAVYAENIYLNAIEHPRATNEVQTRDDRFAIWCMQKFRLHNYRRLAPLFGKLRLVKSPAEMSLMQKACDITEQGFRRVLKFVKPGVAEMQVVAEMIHEYMQHGGHWADYQPIVASGADSCILHYISNHKVCSAGDLLLIDAAASYRLYNADLTRAIPVSGRYTARQKEVYNAVLYVHKAMKDYIKAGLHLRDIDDYANELLIEQLCNLRLCTTSDVQKMGKAHFLDKYCYHSFSHFLGLSVHDAGNKYGPLPESAVITVEPGIYIAAEGIGVRIENNIQVLKEGIHDLMANMPTETEEIEDIMNG